MTTKIYGKTSEGSAGWPGYTERVQHAKKHLKDDRDHSKNAELGHDMLCNKK